MRHVDRAALVLGLGIGGFIDGIVSHHLFGRHHVLSGRYPLDDVHLMMVGDGLFHLLRLLLVLWGAALLNRRQPMPNPVLAGGILTGWGVFTIVEGVADHLVPGVHHGPGELLHDVAFLVVGAVLVVAGVLMSRRSQPAVREHA
ncbi:DUF2243 domain-containing protein [Lentzea sp. CC55]|uniref:DUF2243 domain-containing protein n=1 Tax=Lentzea sp. CC55 TaxID=2884909 RepID=UPI001F209BEB|nr:DUF2243 domain-containing protein [Lentzea sp. CC55]MCG8923047.1 DUF2243 domain-containing protein [Lentzea sp. CC55]